MSSTKPSYAAQVLRILEANVGRSMTLDALEQAIRERWEWATAHRTSAHGLCEPWPTSHLFLLINQE